MKTPPKKTPKKRAVRIPVGLKALTIRQERFCEGVAKGMTATQAYIEAGANVTSSVAKACASKWLTRANIKAHIAFLRTPQTKDCLMSIDEKRRILAEICRTPIGKLGPDTPLCAEFVRTQVAGGTRGKLKRGNAASGNEVSDSLVFQTRVKGYDIIRAIEMDSKLAGHFAPEQLVVETGEKTLASIKERVDSVCSGLNLAKLRRLESKPANA